MTTKNDLLPSSFAEELEDFELEHSIELSESESSSSIFDQLGRKPVNIGGKTHTADNVHMNAKNEKGNALLQPRQSLAALTPVQSAAIEAMLAKNRSISRNNNNKITKKTTRQKKKKNSELVTSIPANGIDTDAHTAVEASAKGLKGPPRVVTLASAEGQALLKQVLSGNKGNVGHYQQLFPKWAPQVGLRNCGLASASVLVNSIPANKRRQLAEHEVLKTADENGCVFNCSSLAATVEARGMTLEQLAHVMPGLPGVNQCTRVHCGEESSCANVEHMRSFLLAALSDGQSRIIVNYHMTTAGQLPFGGHFSTLAAYHGATDRFLILDCWPGTEPLWVEATVLWEATRHHDTDSRRARGFIVTHVARAHDDVPLQPRQLPVASASTTVPSDDIQATVATHSDIEVMIATTDSISPDNKSKKRSRNE